MKVKINGKEYPAWNCVNEDVYIVQISGSTYEIPKELCEVVKKNQYGKINESFFQYGCGYSR